MKIRRARGPRKTFQPGLRSAGSSASLCRCTYSDHEPPHSPRALGLVTEWAELHRVDLIEDWNLARAQAQVRPIAPLE